MVRTTCFTDKMVRIKWCVDKMCPYYIVHTIMSKTILSTYGQNGIQSLYTILSVYHFVQYHFVCIPFCPYHFITLPSLPYLYYLTFITLLSTLLCHLTLTAIHSLPYVHYHTFITLRSLPYIHYLTFLPELHYVIFQSPCHLVLSTRRVLATVLTILLQCFLSAVTSLSSASFIPVTSCISSIHFLLILIRVSIVN